MKRGPVVEVTGATELARQFRAAGKATRDLSAAYRAIARELVSPARSEAPHRTGRLAASVRGLGNKKGATLSAGSARVPYAGPIHWGNPTVKRYEGGTLGVIRPNPFLYRAADKRRDEVVEAFERNIGELLESNGLTP